LGVRVRVRVGVGVRVRLRFRLRVRVVRLPMDEDQVALNLPYISLYISPISPTCPWMRTRSPAEQVSGVKPSEVGVAPSGIRPGDIGEI